MSYALLGLVSILITWKYGNWRNWKNYYSTILFFFISNLVYLVLAQTKPLWYFGETFGHYPIFNIIIMVLYYPSTAILFLSFFPETASRLKQAGYYVSVITIFSFIELIAFLTGGIIYINGWNFYYSILFNTVMFPLIYLHYKKPLAVWPLSAVIAIAFLIIFKIPLHT